MTRIEIGVHLHARPDEAAEKMRAAYGAGCRRFDAAIGGLGGCPFAQDALVGNMPTEVLLAELKRAGGGVAGDAAAGWVAGGECGDLAEVWGEGAVRGSRLISG